MTKWTEEPSIPDLSNLDIDHIMPCKWYEHWPLPDGTSATDAEDDVVKHQKMIGTTLSNRYLATHPVPPVLFVVLRAAASVPAPFRSSFLDPARQGDELTVTAALRARRSTAYTAKPIEGSGSSAPVAG